MIATTPEPDDIISHIDEGFSIELSDEDARRIAAQYASFARVGYDPRERTIELLCRHARQLIFINHVREEHGWTLKAAAAGAKISPRTARRHIDRSAQTTPLSRSLGFDAKDQGVANLMAHAIKFSPAVAAARRHLSRMVDLDEIVADLDEAPDRILNELLTAPRGKASIADFLTSEGLAVVVAEVTGLDPRSLGAAAWHTSALRELVRDGAAEGVDLTNFFCRGLKVQGVGRSLGWPARDLKYRISTEQAWVLTWLLHEAILSRQGAPVVVFHDCASGNESDSVLLSCSFQGSIPIPCRHPAENPVEDGHRREKDILPSDMWPHELPGHLIEATSMIAQRYPARVTLIPRTPLHLHMAGYTLFVRARVKVGHVVSVMGIDVIVGKELPVGTWVVVGIRPEEMLAVGRQPCTLDVFDFDLDLPRAHDGRLWLGKGITRFDMHGQARAVWTPGEGLEPPGRVLLDGSLSTDHGDLLRWDLAQYVRRFGIRRPKSGGDSAGVDQPVSVPGSNEVLDGVTPPLANAEVTPEDTSRPEGQDIEGSPVSDASGHFGLGQTGSGISTPDDQRKSTEAEDASEGASAIDPVKGHADDNLIDGPESSSTEGVAQAGAAGAGSGLIGGEPPSEQPPGGDRIGSPEAEPPDPDADHQHPNNRTPDNEQTADSPERTGLVPRPREDGCNVHEDSTGRPHPSANELGSVPPVPPGLEGDSDLAGPQLKGGGNPGRRVRRPDPVVKARWTRGRVAPYPGKDGEALLEDGGNDPSEVLDWAENAPFAVARERWMGDPVLEHLSVARGPFGRPRPLRVEEDVPGFDPCLDDLIKALTALGLALKAPEARTRIHWCMDALAEVDAHESIDKESIVALERDLEAAMVEAAQSHTANRSAATGRRWARALRRAIR